MNFTLDTMQESMLHQNSRYRKPLQTIKINQFKKIDETSKIKVIEIKKRELEKLLQDEKIKGLVNVNLGETPATEKTARYLNRMIRTIRHKESTATNLVVELYETIVEVRGDLEKSMHKEIFKAFEGEIPLSSIRRILSQYRNGKLG